MLAALASGLLAIVFLLGYVRRHDYSPFVVYRVVVAVIVLGLIASGVRGHRSESTDFGLAAWYEALI